MFTAIRNWVIRTMLKSKGETGIVKTLPNKDLVELNTQITAQKLMANGIEPNSLKNVDQVENAIIAIESRPKVQEGIRSTSSAKVFDMEGKEIKNPKNIMAGEEVNQQTLNEELMKTDNPFSDLVKTTEKGPKSLKQREKEILESMEKNNKETVARIKNRKMIKEAIDNVSPGFAKGDKKYNAEIVAEEIANKRGLDYYDLDTKQQIDIYGEAFDALGDIEKKDFAQGGRAGFSKGGGILKLLQNMIKPKGKVKFDERRFREGPIDLKFLENLEKKDLEKFIRTRDTGGRGGYGMYENFADMPAGLRAAELISTIKGPGNKINYKAAELFLGKKLRGDETVDELLQVLNRQEMRAEGGRAGFSNGGIDVLKIEDEALQRALNAFKYYQSMGGKKNFRNYLREAGRFGDQFRAEGGRIGYKDGPDMGRRTFLKILGGLAAVPIIGKFIKPMKVGKTIQKVPLIKTDNVPGKPEWFDSLVNKVIIEGDDVTKKFATKEREIIHSKDLGDGTTVRVTQDMDDGAVRVEYESDANVFEDTVQMEYKKPLPDEGDPNPAAEFTTAESGPIGRQVSPDDYDIEIDEVGGTSIKDLDSDVSKLKEYATGQKPTIKEIVQNKRRKDKARAITDDPEARMDAVISRQGDYVDDDFSPDFASGGIARMLGE